MTRDDGPWRVVPIVRARRFVELHREIRGEETHSRPADSAEPALVRGSRPSLHRHPRWAGRKPEGALRSERGGGVRGLEPLRSPGPR